jgi:5-methyltetrahydrofolate--homocysteine methyltransferase
MADLVTKVQSVTDRPLAIDTPDPAIAEAGLKAYDPDRAGGKPPILNSVAVQRLAMLELYRVRPFMPILLASERQEGGEGLPCKTAQETADTARALLRAARAGGLDIPNASCIIDPGLGPLACDMEGLFRQVMEAMRTLHADPDFRGVHMSVGLSNFTHMLPSKRADGSPIRGVLESAFLTRAIPLGLDMFIGSVKRKYRLLPPDHPAMVCLDEVLQAEEGIDAIKRVQAFYRS